MSVNCNSGKNSLSLHTMEEQRGNDLHKKEEQRGENRIIQTKGISLASLKV